MHTTRSRSAGQLALALAFVAMAMSGCASGPKVRALGFHTELAKPRYAQRDTSASATVAGDTPPPIVVQSTANIGCFFAANVYTCMSLVAREQKDAVKELRAAMVKAQGVAGTVYMEFAEMTAEFLRKRLAQRYAQASVTVATRAPAGAMVVGVDLAQQSRSAHIALTATMPSGVSMTAAGKITRFAARRAHFAWMIPVYVLTFPASSLWMPPVVRLMHKNAERSGIVDATDLATQDLVAQLLALPPPAVPVELVAQRSAAPL